MNSGPSLRFRSSLRHQPGSRGGFASRAYRAWSNPPALRAGLGLRPRALSGPSDFIGEEEEERKKASAEGNSWAKLHL